mmetsp:Transcript_30672/g.62610  ORF Transcript_30672/g.62610 Transcript_30672/m.62610 type:complete len:208 (+) Transcript_30672:1055-1678(+)
MRSWERSVGYVLESSSARAVQNSETTSKVWRANSREGARTMPTGPSPGTRGIRASSSKAAMTRGREKLRVLPLPVKAMPTMSLPERATVSPCIWMGVGRLTFFFWRARSTGGGKAMSLKLRMGGGMSSPSTSMCHFCRILSHSSSPWRRMDLGQRQEVGREDLYLMPSASSEAAWRALVWTWEASLRMRCSSCWRWRAERSWEVSCE